MNEEQIEEKNNKDVEEIIAIIKSKNPNVNESYVNKMYKELKQSMNNNT
ncbi:hypothetical protein G9F73_003420 [Clostridium estertheticum]|nr:hypothetical protein [Clostridium estertheticum]MBZ9606880.1 hypothetical protein [Clostridium estertheticum]